MREARSLEKARGSLAVEPSAQWEAMHTGRTRERLTAEASQPCSRNRSGNKQRGLHLWQETTLLRKPNQPN